MEVYAQTTSNELSLWPTITAGDLTSFTLPRISAEVYVLDNNEGVPSPLPLSLIEILVSTFTDNQQGTLTVSSTEDTVSLQQDLSLLVSESPFYTRLVESTLDCIESLEDEQAEDFVFWIIDPSQGARTSRELLSTVEEYRPLAENMMEAWKTNRCEIQNSTSELIRTQRVIDMITLTLQAFVSGELSSPQNFGLNDRFVAWNVLFELFFDTDEVNTDATSEGIYTRQAKNALRDELQTLLDNLDFVPSDDEYETVYSTTLDFIAQEKTRSIGLSDENLKKIILNCHTDLNDLFDTFSISNCLQLELDAYILYLGIPSEDNPGRWILGESL